MSHPPAFFDELVTLLGKHDMQRGSDTPDHVLAQFICDCLTAFDRSANAKLPYITLPQINAHERRR